MSARIAAYAAIRISLHATCCSVEFGWASSKLPTMSGGSMFVMALPSVSMAAVVVSRVGGIPPRVAKKMDVFSKLAPFIGGMIFDTQISPLMNLDFNIFV